MEKTGTRPLVRSEFFIALVSVVLCIAGYLLLPKYTSDLMLGVIRARAKVEINFDKCQTRGFFWVRYQNLSVARSGGVTVTARDAVIQYNILDLIFKHLNLKLLAKGIKVRTPGGSVGKAGLIKNIEFGDMESVFTLAAKRKIRIDYLKLSGPMGSIFVKGRLQEKVDVDLRFSCFLSREFLLELPKFVQENLFRDNELPLKQFKFSLRGLWFQPSIDFQSDLIEFNFKARN